MPSLAPPERTGLGIATLSLFQQQEAILRGSFLFANRYHPGHCVYGLDPHYR
jgi:hypothetical protein